MSNRYKEELAEFKQHKHDPEISSRIYPKTRKLKPYKVYVTFKANNIFSEREFLFGRYAKPEDAEKAMKAAMKRFDTLYSGVRCEPPIP